jgi:hypothetical protein
MFCGRQEWNLLMTQSRIQNLTKEAVKKRARTHSGGSGV